jgi:hypothetical protein
MLYENKQKITTKPDYLNFVQSSYLCSSVSNSSLRFAKANTRMSQFA